MVQQAVRRDGWHAGSLRLAWALCLAWLVLALFATRGEPPLTPDSTHYAVTARSLVQGEGFRIGFVPLHLGLYEEVRHVPEMHGLLRPVVLAGVFGLLGPEASGVRIPGMVYVSLTGLLAFLLCRRLFGPWPAVFACVFVLTQPLPFVLAWSGNDDVGLVCFATATLGFLHRALDGGRTRDFALAGAAAALALAEKASALLLLLVFAWPLLLCLRRPRRVRIGQLAWLLLPFGFVVGLYLLRNVVAHGSPEARFAVANWMWKAAAAHKLEAFFALHEPLPSLWELLRTLGWQKILLDAYHQLELFLGWTFRLGPWLGWGPRDSALTMPGFVAPLGVVALAGLARRERSFSTLVGLAALGAVGLVCGLYHASLRFFLFLTPLLGIAVAGLLVRIRGTGASGARRALALGTGLAVVGMSGWAWASTAFLGPRMVPTRGLGPCRNVLQYLQDTTPPQQRVLSFAPWSVAWETGREAIQIPSGGPDAIARVARHYGARWILVQPHPERPFSVRALRQLEATGAAGLRASAARVHGSCRLLRLETVP